LFKVREVYAAGALAAFGARLGPPKTVVGETVREIAQADLGSIFCCEADAPPGMVKLRLVKKT
jgi:hypothetical protein